MTTSRSFPASPATIGFKRHLKVDVVAGEAVYTLSERGVTAVRGSTVETLAPLLDGTRDLEELRRALPAGVSGAEAAGVLLHLMDAGLVTLHQRTGDVDERALAYWAAGGLDPAEATGRTGTSRAQLIVAGGEPGLGAAALAALEAAGVTATTCPAGELDPDSALSVVLCDDYLAPQLAAIDDAHRAAGRPWLLAKPLGAQIWIGPVFGTPGVGCWHCLAARQWAHRSAEAHLQQALGRSGPASRPQVWVPPVATIALNLIALEVLKWLAGYTHAGQRHVWTVDTLDVRAGAQHELRARPQCHNCGDAMHMRALALRPFEVTSRAKARGAHRAAAPEQIWAGYRHLISPVTGVVRELVRDERGPDFCHTYQAGPNVIAGARSLERLQQTVQANNGGTGRTAQQARISALCEALERHSGYFHGDEATLRGSYASMRGQAIHPNDWLLYDQRQYRDAAAWNAAHGAAQFVCDPFDEHGQLDWTPVWSLTHRQRRLLPTGMLYFDGPGTATGCQLRADSNGSAAGASKEDALLHGMLELIERDAVALWWYNRTPVPGIDIAAFADPWIEELLEVYAGLGREVWLLDLTADLGVPTVAAVSRLVGQPREDIVFGFGAHLDPQVAIGRALAEMNQLLPAVVDAGPAGDYRLDDPDAQRWWRTVTVAGQPYLAPDPAAAPRVPADLPSLAADDLAEDIALLQGRIEAKGMEVLVLDQQRPDIGLPVVKVIVPGMRHFWARYGPGRLFDVPVQLGRLTAPTPYAELNPIPLFV